MQAGQAAPSTADRKVFRLPWALVAWWAWVALAVAALIDLVLSTLSHASAEIALTVVLVTGVMYACALRPRVVADAAGITVCNPLRDHRVPWGSVTGIDLAESVRVHCAGKTIHSWALAAQSSARLRYGGIGRMSFFSADQQPSRLPSAQTMATELSELAADARARGVPAGPCVVTWRWQPAVAMLVPAVALVLVSTLTH